VTRGGLHKALSGDSTERDAAEALFSGKRAPDPVHFTGVEMLAPIEAIAAWMRAAKAGDEFTYCEARGPLRGEGWFRMGELARDGLVRTHERKRAGGGKCFYAVRTRKGLPAKLEPMAATLADPATDIIFRALKRAANLSQPCPTDTDLARAAGLNTRDQAQWRVRKLADVGLIGSTLAYDGGVPARVVTIATTRHAGTAAGKFTALPKRWAALQAAAARDAAEGGR
jgi:hypothetical protein